MLYFQIVVALNNRFGVERQKEVGRRGPQGIAKEPGRCDADDGEGFVVEGEDGPDEGRVGTVPLLPDAVAHHRHRWRPRFVIRGGEEASRGGPDPKHREVVAGDELAPIALRNLRPTDTTDAELLLRRRKRRQVGKAGGVISEIRVEVGPDQRELFVLAVAGHVAAAAFPAKAVQLLGMGDRERRQQHRMDQREDRRSGANPQCQRQDGGDGERRREAEVPESITRILQGAADGREAPLLPVAFLHRFDGAKLQGRLPPCLDWREAGAYVVGRLQRDMLVNLLAQPRLVTARGGPSGEAPEASPQRSHCRSSAFTAKNRPIIAAVCSQPWAAVRARN